MLLLLFLLLLLLLLWLWLLLLRAVAKRGVRCKLRVPFEEGFVSMWSAIPHPSHLECLEGWNDSICTRITNVLRVQQNRTKRALEHLRLVHLRAVQCGAVQCECGYICASSGIVDLEECVCVCCVLRVVCVSGRHGGGGVCSFASRTERRYRHGRLCEHGDEFTNLLLLCSVRASL